MSRPASRKGSAKGKKGKGKKEKPKTPKQMVAELTEQNEKLTTELTTVKNEADGMRFKLDALSKKLVASVNKKEFKISTDTDPNTLSLDTLLDMLGKLVVKKRINEMSVEARAEELETRVTEMSMDLAKMTKKTLAYETGLADIANSSDLEEIRDRVYSLQLIAGQSYHTFTALDPMRKEEPYLNGVDEIPDSATSRSLQNAAKLNLVPPQRKFPGETHLKTMHKDLRLYVMKELSVQKPSGADWRMFAERVGVEQETIEYWKSLRLEFPMGRVLAEWSESPAASVRMLHRHLMSPQLRCTILGKRVADFYEVD